MVSQVWNKWSTETPPVEGSFKTKRGWEFENPDGSIEVLVAMRTADPSGVGDVGNITSIKLPSKKVFKVGNTVSFTVNYNEPVDVTNTPRLELTLASGTVYADYASGTGTNKLKFSYVVQADDIDLNGLVIEDNIDLNTTGTVKDKDTSDDATLLFTGSDYDTSEILVDAVVRTLDNVSSNSGNISTGNTVDVTITYNQPVLVEGTPRIPMFANDGTTALENVYADYVSGAGTTSLLFQYIVDTNDNQALAIKAGADIDLNEGTITDFSKTVNSPVTFTQATLTGVTLNQ